jgi:hypothetical protein
MNSAEWYWIGMHSLATIGAAVVGIGLAGIIVAWVTRGRK